MCSTLEEEKQIVNYLLELGCCLNCSVRYLCDKQLEFNELEDFLSRKAFIKNEEICISKRIKANPCIICLGLLQETFITEIIQCPDLEMYKNYDSSTFSVSVSMPISILLRERSLRIHLEEKFPEIFTYENNEIPINRVWKMFIKNPLAKHLNKKFINPDFGEFFINVTAHYSDDVKELDGLQQIHPKDFETRSIQHRKYHGELYTRKGVLELLAKTSARLFSIYFPVPPKVPDFFVTCKSIECKKTSCFLAGRYCKFSRDLPQSPWVINDVRIMETSVQEIIFQAIKKVFEIPEESMKFSSSGREDCDVRCLGNGRPFYIDISDPKKSEFSFKELAHLEKVINESPLIQVRYMQKVNKADLLLVKNGEESKTKAYTALCIVEEPVSDEMLQKVNATPVPIKLKQKTPIRVLHRRSLDDRIRNILEIKACKTEHPKAFELSVVTDAGTYVKEFVHGDFGRTVPNLSTILGIDVDIAALDVTAINLDWPKEIINPECDEK